MPATVWILALAACGQQPPVIAVPDPPGLRPAVVTPPLGIPDPPGLHVPPSPSALPALPAYPVPTVPPQPYMAPSSPVQPWDSRSYSHSSPHAYVLPEPANYSSRLKAELRGEYLYIIQNRQKVNFWGARIVTLEPGSPLEALGLRVGDVITRLDNVRISEGMHLARESVTGRSYYKLPELDRHHSMTEVRYIKTGTHDVKIGRVDLGPPGDRAPAAPPP
jgi:hypothetical protein